MSSTHLFFTPSDFETLRADNADRPALDLARHRMQDKLLWLYDRIHIECRRRRWDLYPHWQVRGILSPRSGEFMALAFTKSEVALRLMQKRAQLDRSFWDATTLLVVRADGQGIAVEILVSTNAVADGENLKQKLRFGPPEKQGVRQLFAELGGGFALSLKEKTWSGVCEILRARCGRLVNLGTLNATFEEYDPRKHDLTIGINFEPDDERLTSGQMVDEILYRFGQLYPLYQFVSWSPRNNYLLPAQQGLSRESEHSP